MMKVLAMAGLLTLVAVIHGQTESDDPLAPLNLTTAQMDCITALYIPPTKLGAQISAACDLDGTPNVSLMACFSTADTHLVLG